MTQQDQVNFLLQLNLEGLRKSESGYNCRCPICHDSTKNRSKRRFWALTRKKSDELVMYCHNCGYSSSFKFFLKQVDSELYKEYERKERQDFFDTIKSGGNFFNKEKKVVELDKEIKYRFLLNDKYFHPARYYNKAIDFCKRRKIDDKINELYYCVNPKLPCHEMIVFPCYAEDGKQLMSFMARHTEYKKFHIHNKNESFKVFNFFNVNLSESVFIFESIIDSFCLENSIAALGADISNNILHRIKHPILIFDTDSTGKRKTLKYLEKGYSCYIPPDNFKYKDFNEAICAGYSKDKLKHLVHENIYNGLKGITKIKFNLMRK